MSVSFNQLTVNYPNIPVLVHPGPQTPAFGEFIPTPADGMNDFGEDVMELSSSDMYVPNFALRILGGTFYQDAVLSNRRGEGADLLGSCLFLKGKVKSVLDGNSEAIEAFQHQQNFKFDPENHFRHLIPAHKQFRFVHFSYTSEYLEKILPEGELWADELKSKIARGERVFGQRPVEITPLQERALQTVFDNPLQGKLGLMLLETAITQIILIQLNGLFKETPCNFYAGVRKRDVEIIHDVREHIGRTFLDDHSLCNLAMQFGVNTNKLMNTFKKLFGKSIFEYIQDLRMQHAQQLLQDKDMQVTEVARVIGYKNPNHFSAAFKRQFGYCPSSAR